VHFNENVGEASLSPPRVNIGEDALPSSPVNPASSPVIGATNVSAARDRQLEEGELDILASQDTAGPTSQRFVAQTPRDVLGGVDAGLRAPTSPKVEMEDTDLGGGATAGSKVNEDISKDGARAAKDRKGTFTATLDFDDSDDNVFDEEAEGAKAARLTESTIDVNTGKKVACQLEKGVSMG